MKQVLLLLTSSYPYGQGEAFVEHEMPFLARAFDEVVVVSNDTTSEQTRPLPPSVTSVRRSYLLSRREKLLGLQGLLRPPVRRELRRVHRRPAPAWSRAVLSTVLVSWRKAARFARLLRDLARRHPGARVHAYSYWANDMALAAALARSRGWVDAALCRAHGWDVYLDRAETGYLPFRHFLARELDHYLFVSDHGLAYFREQMGRDYPSLGRSRLGTPALADDGPLARRRPFTVLSCSSLIPLKRVELLARALALLPERLEVRWLHAGDGPTRSAVEALVRELPPHVTAELPGYLPNEAVLELYGSLRPSVLVNVSEFEGLPVSMMEALSAGVPVVATEVGGVGEMVRHQENGLLLPAHPTPGEVAAALTALAELPDGTYDAYGRRALATWREGFDAATNYPAFLHQIGATTP